MGVPARAGAFPGVRQPAPIPIASPPPNDPVWVWVWVRFVGSSTEVHALQAVEAHSPQCAGRPRQRQTTANLTKQASPKIKRHLGR
eukprot:8163790-Pyramimonas_sp.AAC.1